VERGAGREVRRRRLGVDFHPVCTSAIQISPHASCTSVHAHVPGATVRVGVTRLPSSPQVSVASRTSSAPFEPSISQRAVCLPACLFFPQVHASHFCLSLSLCQRPDHGPSVP
jgi:hypothetical protein